MNNWEINIDKDGRKILTTPGGIDIDLTEMSYDPSLVFYNSYCLMMDIKNHRHFLRCHHCNKPVSCYSNHKGFVLCEKCVAPHHIATTAQTINNPWFDLLAEIKNSKIKKSNEKNRI